MFGYEIKIQNGISSLKANLPSKNLDIKHWEHPTQGSEYPGQKNSMNIRKTYQKVPSSFPGKTFMIG